MQNIDIKLKPSKLFMILSLLVIVVHIIIAVTLSICWILKLFLIVAVILYGSWVFWTVILMKGPKAIIGLLLLKNGLCYVRYPFTSIEVEVQEDSLVTPAICVLRLESQIKKLTLSCILFPDSVEQAMYKKMLVWLKYHGAKRLRILISQSE